MATTPFLEISNYTTLESIKPNIDVNNYVPYLELSAIMNRVEMITEMNLFHRGALELACAAGSIKVIDYFLTHKNDIYKPVYNNRSCLEYSVFHSKFEATKHIIENYVNFEEFKHYPLKSACKGYLKEYVDMDLLLYLKKLYIQKYQEKFLCYNCIVLPICNQLCSEEIVKK